MTKKFNFFDMIETYECNKYNRALHICCTHVHVKTNTHIVMHIIYLSLPCISSANSQIHTDLRICLHTLSQFKAALYVIRVLVFID